jgi:hypothetical protein
METETPNPPSQPPPRMNMPTDVARLPIPGNAEFLFVLVALIIGAIIVAIDGLLNSGAWWDYFKWISAAYILSRGIAKASRVLEQ